MNPPFSSPAIQNEKETNDLQDEAVEILILSIIIDIRFQLEVLLELKLCGHTDILTKPSNQINEIYDKGGIQTEKLYQKALHKVECSKEL